MSESPRKMLEKIHKATADNKEHPEVGLSIVRDILYEAAADQVDDEVYTTWSLVRINPIDLFWDELQDVDSYIKDAYRAKRHTPSISEIYAELSAVKRWAKECGWEGDFTQGPKIFFYPADGIMAHGFVFKQCNNGDTFVAAPHRLEHLNVL